MQQPPNLAAPTLLPAPMFPPPSTALPPPPFQQLPPRHPRPPRAAQLGPRFGAPPQPQFRQNAAEPGRNVQLLAQRPMNGPNCANSGGGNARFPPAQLQSGHQLHAQMAAAFIPANCFHPSQLQLIQAQHQNGPAVFVPAKPMENVPPEIQPLQQHQQFRPPQLPQPAGPPIPTAAVPMPIAMHQASPAAMAAAHAHPPQVQAVPAPNPAMISTGHLVGTSKSGPSPVVENFGGDCWSTAVTGWEQAAMIKNKIGLVVNGRYRIVQSIASGSYGEIFAAEDLHSAGPKKQRVAVKFDGACRDNHLRYEYDVYKSVLYEDGNGKVEGFPQVHSWSHEYGHNIMVMELLGAPVASLFAFCDRKFARQTIVSLGEQMIQRIRHLHQRGFIHRDIKPENFLMGLAGKESTLYLIDFGLARRYRFREGEQRTLTHIPYRRGRSFIGTAKYASLNSHKNIELSRRDDLESLAYVLIELVTGHLPWKNISKRNATTRHQASQRIRQLKEQTHWEEYCPPVARFIRYCREIPFSDEPDYDKLLDLLQLIGMPEYSAPILAIPPTAGNFVGGGRQKKVSSAVCCQTLQTAEKMTQVDLEQQVNAGQQEEREEEVSEATERPTSSTQYLVHSMQRQLSLNVAENASDFEEIGAATTTTSCSENELDSAAVGGVTTRSGTGTADDEDSQPTPQQVEQQQQVCRKCRRLRDQTHQQKRVKIKEQPQQRQPRVDTALQTDLPPAIVATRTVVPPPPGMQQKPPLPPGGEQRKMCWQRARESNAERRFQYENKFSWTLPTEQPVLVPAQQAYGFLPQPMPVGQHPMMTAGIPIMAPNGSGLITGIVQQQPPLNEHCQNKSIVPMGMPMINTTMLPHQTSAPTQNSFHQTNMAVGNQGQFHLSAFSQPPPIANFAPNAPMPAPIMFASMPPPPIPPLISAQQNNGQIMPNQQDGNARPQLQFAFVVPPPTIQQQQPAK